MNKWARSLWLIMLSAGLLTSAMSASCPRPSPESACCCAPQETTSDCCSPQASDQDACPMLQTRLPEESTLAPRAFQPDCMPALEASTVHDVSRPIALLTTTGFIPDFSPPNRDSPRLRSPPTA